MDYALRAIINAIRQSTAYYRETHCVGHETLLTIFISMSS